MNSKPEKMVEPDAHHAPLCLVLERNLLVAEDLIGALTETGPCRVVHLTQSEDVAAALEGDARVAVAFLEMNAAELLESGFLGLLQGRGAHIVLTASEEDAQAGRDHGVSMLRRPFTDRMIRRIMSGPASF